MRLGLWRRKGDEEFGNECDWMTRLPKSVKEKPLSALAIPGSHDSFTHSLVPGSEAGPDQPEPIRKFAKDFPCLAKFIFPRWSYTQSRDVSYQLEHGIRYFDIRLVAHKGNGPERFVIIHCLCGQPVLGILENIKQFLDNHAGEVVLLDFQHLYNFDEKDEADLTTMVIDIFGKSLCPQPHDLANLSLQSMNSSRQQVIAILPRPRCSLFWSRTVCPTPWPNTRSSTHLRRFLTEGLKTRNPRCLFVSQAVFTPNLATVILNFFSTLKKSCARRCNLTTRAWLTETGASPNILITDFVLSDQCSGQIVSHLINLNYDRQTDV